MKVSSTENGIIFGNIGKYQNIVCYYSCVSFTQKSGNFCQDVKGGTKFTILRRHLGIIIRVNSS